MCVPKCSVPPGDCLSVLNDLEIAHTLAMLYSMGFISNHMPGDLKESLHIISGATFHYEIHRLSSLKHGLVMGKRSLKRNKSKDLYSV